MTVTKTSLKSLENEITCSYGCVFGGVTTVFFGTNDGDIYRYNAAADTLTKLINVGGKVESIAMVYSGTLYVGIEGGDFASVTTS